MSNITMDEATKSTAAGEPAATSTIEVDGLRIEIDRDACVSWDAVMLSRDINKLQKQYSALPEGTEQAETVLDAVALMYEYVLLVTDLTREKVSAHMGDKASFQDVSAFLGRVMQGTRPKN